MSPALQGYEKVTIYVPVMGGKPLPLIVSTFGNGGTPLIILLHKTVHVFIILVLIGIGFSTLKRAAKVGDRPRSVLGWGIVLMGVGSLICNLLHSVQTYVIYPWVAKSFKIPPFKRGLMYWVTLSGAMMLGGAILTVIGIFMTARRRVEV